MTTPDENKAITRRAFEEFITNKNPAAAPKYLTPDFVGHYPDLPPVQGVEGFQQFLGMYLNAFPDSRVTIEDILAEGDRVAVRITFRGTHQGELMGIPATGKSIAMGALNIFRILDGKAAEQWVNQDDLGLMQQLGVIPAPGG
jgi:steroid delta-isomerase-like uncharacterized protein